MANNLKKLNISKISIIAISILFIAFTYIWFSYLSILTLSFSDNLIVFFVFSFVFIIQIARWLNSDFCSWSYLVVFTIYYSQGLICVLFFAAVFKDFGFLIMSYLIEINSSEVVMVNGLTFVACFVSTMIGAYQALLGPKVKSVEVHIKDLPEELSGFVIAQISDLHIGPLIKRSYVEKVVENLNSLNADIIAITGDLGDRRVKQIEEDLEPLRSLNSTYGKYYISGNHEYYWNINEWEEKIKELGIKLLHNSGCKIEFSNHSIWLGGVPDYAAHKLRPGDISSPELSQTKSSVDFKILLAHQPHSCDAAFNAGYNLMLSGHTHAGQFFPFNLLVGFFNPYVKGLNLHKNKMWVYVNSGTGFWGPPNRFLIPSEITKLKLIRI